MLAVGCFGPRYESGGLECAPGGTCPGGFYCASDTRCWKVGEQPPVEGPETDGAVPDVNGDQPPAMPPILIMPASANPSPVTGTSTLLSVQAEDPQGEGSGLTYYWSVIGPGTTVTVSGPGTVGFSVNSSSAAHETTAIFTKAGRYTFTVNIFNKHNQSVSSMVEVEVQAKLNDLAVIPSMPTVPLNGTAQFMAMAFDQFGDPLVLTTQPRWRLIGNCGLINENGLFTGGGDDGQRLHRGWPPPGGSPRSPPCRWEPTPPTELHPVADSYVDDGEPDKNFGEMTVMYVKTQTDSTNNRTAYLKFSLAGVSGPVTAAKFRLFGRAFGGTHMHRRVPRGRHQLVRDRPHFQEPAAVGPAAAPRSA